MAFAGFGAAKPATTTGGNIFGGTPNPTGATAANPFGSSLFGQPAQQQQQQQQSAAPNTGGGLFGSTNTANTGGTGLFGAPTTNTNMGGGGGLFGSTTNTNAAGGAGTGGGLFGQNANTNTAGTTGLFGQQQQQPQQQTGLFGSTANANTGGGLFGSNPNNAATANTTGGGGLFGSTNTNTGGGLFGSTANTNTAGMGGGLFATQPAGAFGSTNNAFGGSTLFGKAPSQANTQQVGQQSHLNATTQSGNVPFTKSTKFNDLPENFRKVLESIDSHIQGRTQISKELKQRTLGEEPSRGQVRIRDLHKELVDITNTIRNDAHLTQDLKDKVDQANPQSGNTYLKDHASFPLEYFTRVTEQMSQRLAWYKSTIEQIERKLSSSSSQAQTPQAVVTTLQTQHATFLALANRTAALDAEVQKIKAIYTQLWRQKTGSVRDPFDGNGKVAGPETGMEFSMKGLNLSSSMR
ncbi:hypothetical protein FA13DRAFT_1738549 [Coprinellus micaceus]|uniref:Nucleoporin nup45 n=1 Tax=Coprinellus micaceus TaxID=71717 RepID=A0A4Y7STE7_COPMI|nr:hypothetical protein FA13DRAFT_1738549 [Coprinellus micaceus]